MLRARQYKIQLDTFDLLKGLLMIHIILGHKSSNYTGEIMDNFFLSPVSLIIANAAIPAFFIITGMSFRTMPGKKSLSKTFRELIIPYLYVMVAYAVLFPLIHYANFRWWPGARHELIRYFLAFLLGIPESGKMVLGYELYWCSTVWYFLALFVALNFLNWILKLKNEILQAVVVLVCTYAGYWFAKADINFYCIPQGLIGVGYCYIGYFIKKIKLYTHPKLPLICVLLAIPAMIQVVWGEFGLAYGTFKYGFVECILAGCAGMLFVFLGILGNAEWKILDPIKNIGIYSYWILCIHAVETGCIPWYRWKAYMGEHQMLGYIIELAATGFLIAICCMILKRISKLRYRWRRMVHGR